VKRVISFDLDGTLVAPEFGDLVWNQGIPIEFAKKYGIPFEKAKGIVISEYESIGDENILWYDIEYWIRRMRLDIKAEELLDRYGSHIRLVDGAEEALYQLKDRFLLILSSNASRIFVEKELKHTGIAHFFTHIFSATSDFKIVKKDKAFYEKILDILCLRAEEMVHIGDHPIFDYEVPKSLGIESYLVGGKRGLREIIDVL